MFKFICRSTKENEGSSHEVIVYANDEDEAIKKVRQARNQNGGSVYVESIEEVLE